MKKIGVSFLAVIGFILMLALPVHAEGYTVDLKSDKETVTAGSQFTVGVELNHVNIGSNDSIMTFDGILEYDNNILETVSSDSIVGSNGFSINYGESSNNKILANTMSKGIKSDIEVAKITFKVKTDATLGKTTIKIKNAHMGVVDDTNRGRNISNNGNEIIISVKNITSDKYKIGDDEITGVLSGTNVATLTSNLSTDATVTVEDKNGNAIDDNAVVGTGCVVKVNGTDSYTVIVRGDLSGEGVINIHDLGLIKRYLIEKITLEGAYLKAADVNADGTVDSLDIIEIILHIIELKVL